MTAPSSPGPSLLGLDEPQKRRDLARMKRTATGFLLVTAGVFVATFAGPDAGWVGWVRAAAAIRPIWAASPTAVARTKCRG